MKLKRLIGLTVLTTMTLTNTLFALTPEVKAQIDIQHQELIKRIEVLEASKIEPLAESTVIFKDRFDNHLAVDVNSPWGPKLTRYSPSFPKEKARATKPGYKKQEFTPIKGELIVTLTPDKITQIFMGSLKLPETTPKDNWWVALLDKTHGSHQGPAYTLKVQKNGTFKTYNVPDGDYKVEIYQSNNGNPTTRTAEKLLEIPTMDLEITGNVNLELDYSEKIVESPMSFRKYFNEPDYTDPSAFLEIYPNLELNDELKKIADKFNDKKDLSTVREILKYVYTYWAKKPNPEVRHSIRYIYDVQKLHEYGYFDNCAEAEAMFEALAKYKGIPTIGVDAYSTAWMAQSQAGTDKVGVGHAFAEVYVDGKWVLVDPSTGDIYENYDTENYFISKEIDIGYGLINDPFQIIWKGKPLATVYEDANPANIMLGKSYDFEMLKLAPPAKVTEILK